MQAPPPWQGSVNAAVARLVGPVKVELDGLTKSTRNLKVASVLALAPRPTMKLGSPEGGGAALSTSEARRAPMLALP
jgi:hypothetical protein